jgi:hypothetical protein
MPFVLAQHIPFTLAQPMPFAVEPSGNIVRFEPSGNIVRFVPLTPAPTPPPTPPPTPTPAPTPPPPPPVVVEEKKKPEPPEVPISLEILTNLLASFNNIPFFCSKEIEKKLSKIDNIIENANNDFTTLNTQLRTYKISIGNGSISIDS